jgi:hypothetical protein
MSHGLWSRNSTRYQTYSSLPDPETRLAETISSQARHVATIDWDRLPMSQRTLDADVVRFQLTRKANIRSLEEKLKSGPSTRIYTAALEDCDVRASTPPREETTTPTVAVRDQSPLSTSQILQFFDGVDDHDWVRVDWSLTTTDDREAWVGRRTGIRREEVICLEYEFSADESGLQPFTDELGGEELLYGTLPSKHCVVWRLLSARSPEELITDGSQQEEQRSEPTREARRGTVRQRETELDVIEGGAQEEFLKW